MGQGASAADRAHDRPGKIACCRIESDRLRDARHPYERSQLNGAIILWQLRSDHWVQLAKQQEKYPIMMKKLIVIALAVFAFGLGSVVRSNAGTEVREPYRSAAPSHNYPLP